MENNNTNTQMEFKNEFLHQGKIVRMNKSEKMTSIVLAVGDTKKSSNYPEIVFMGEHKDKVNTFNIGDLVCIKSYCQSFLKQEGNRQSRKQALNGYEIAYAKPLLSTEFDIEGTRIRNVNEFVLAGRVKGCKAMTEHLVSFLIHINRENKNSLIIAYVFTDNAAEFIKNIKNDMEIYGVGNVQTSTKEVNGERRHYQDFTFTDIRLC